MRKSSRRAVFSGRTLLEALESRQLLSSTVVTVAASPTLMDVTTTVTGSTVMLSGVPVNAEAGQAFRAVVGRVTGLTVPSMYTLKGSIDWGDGTAASSAVFVKRGDGSYLVLGSHTYDKVGTDTIMVTVAANPPPWSLAPVILVGSFKSTAKVISSPGGVTLNETVKTAFKARVGFFHSTLPESSMTAVIRWGDGIKSAGTIVLLPTAGPIPTLAVDGSHTYAKIGSYIVHVEVYETGTTNLVAKFNSVIDVLPPLPTTTTP